MPHTEQDLDRLINEILDENKSCAGDLPYVCGLINSEHGRKRLFEYMKKMVLEQGMTDLEAILSQVEDAHDWNY